MFVDEDYLKEETPIGQNVDISKVIPWVNEVISQYIEPILGEYFLGQVTQRYIDGNTTTADDGLIAKMKPAIAWGAAAYSIYGTSYKVKNKGLQKQFGDYSESTEANEKALMFDMYRQNARSREQKMKKFVCLNISNYSEATDKRNKDGEVYNDCGCDGGEVEGFNDSIMII
jgi:hypothetical protein